MEEIFYVTKWWRTRGIVTGARRELREGWVGSQGFAHKIGKDAFPNIQEARDHVRKLAARKAEAFLRQASRCQRISDGDFASVPGARAVDG